MSSHKPCSVEATRTPTGKPVMADKENRRGRVSAEAWDEDESVGSGTRSDRNRLLKAVMKGAAPPLKTAVSASRPLSTVHTATTVTRKAAPAKAASSSQPPPTKESQAQTPGRRLSVGALDKLGLVSRSTGKPLTPQSRCLSVAVSGRQQQDEIEEEDSIQKLRKREKQLLRQNNHLASLYEECNESNRDLDRANRRLQQEVLRLRLELARLRVPTSATAPAAKNATPRDAASKLAASDRGAKSMGVSMATQTSGRAPASRRSQSIQCAMTVVGLAVGLIDDSRSMDEVPKEIRKAAAESPPPLSLARRKFDSLYYLGDKRRSKSPSPITSQTGSSRTIKRGEGEALSRHLIVSPPRHPVPPRRKSVQRSSNIKVPAPAPPAPVPAPPPSSPRRSRREAQMNAEDSPHTEALGVRPSRAVTRVCYKEPSLSRKIRKGHVFFPPVAKPK